VNFAVHTLFTQTTATQVPGGATIAVPVLTSLDLFALVVALVSFVGMLKFQVERAVGRRRRRARPACCISWCARPLALAAGAAGAAPGIGS